MVFPFPRLSDISVRNQRVLLRVDYNISTISNDRGERVPENDARIRATLPTLRYLLNRGCSILLLSWLKRPAGTVVEDLRMAPLAIRLSEMLDHHVNVMRSVVGRDVQRYLRRMQRGDIAMLENVRFYPEELKNSTTFAKKIAKLADTVIFDAFSHAHRDVPSVTGLIHYAKNVAVGRLFESEYRNLSRLREHPKRPLVAILGGAKISDRLDVLERMLEEADSVLIGGALANTLLKASGTEVGGSMVESSVIDRAGKKKNYLAIAQKIWKRYGSVTINGLPKLILPIDGIIADTSTFAHPMTVSFCDKRVPTAQGIFDIGPKTIRRFTNVIKHARMIFWNGPLGMLELQEFSHATHRIAEMLAHSSATTILAGGDTGKLLDRFQMGTEDFDHVSLGGGATLKFLAGLKLPALRELERRMNKR